MRSIRERVLALLLALVMVVGVLPVSAFATEDEQPIDTAIFFSDLHSSSSNSKTSTVSGIMSAVSGLPVSSVTSCGDAFSINSSTPTDAKTYKDKTAPIIEAIQSGLGKTDVAVNFVWSDHDRYAVLSDGTTKLDSESGFIYGAGKDGIYGNADDDNYYVYELSMADLSTNDRYNTGVISSGKDISGTINKFLEVAATLDQSKPLFIASHQPLLDRRNDNGHAYKWATAINEVAEDMDVAFFFGHNHKYDVEADYYYAKGSTVEVCNSSSGGSTKVTLNFTHLCTGYLDPSTTGSTSSTTRQGVIVVTNIYADRIEFTTYDKNGVYTGKFKVSESVEREHAPEPAILTAMKVVGQKEFTVGDAFVKPATVTAVYSDGTTKDITSEVTFSGYNMNTVGTQKVTVTWGAYNGAYDITVKAKPVTSVDVTVGDVTATIAGADVTASAPISAEDKAVLDAKGYDAYVALDVTATVTGDSATVSVAIPEGWDPSRIVGISMENGTVKEIPGTVADGKFTFSVSHFSASGIALLGETGNWVTVVAPGKYIVYKYQQITSGVPTGNFVIVAGNHDAALQRDGEKAVVAAVTIDGTTMTSEENLAQWFLKESPDEDHEYRIRSAADDAFLRNQSGIKISDHSTARDGAEWNLTQKENGIYCFEQGSSNKNWISYNGTTWQQATGASDLRLYTYTGMGEATRDDGLFARVEGNTSYTVAQSASTVDAEKLIKAGITVYTSNNTSVDGTAINDTEYTLALGGYSITSPVGSKFTVSVMYQDVVVGTVTLTVGDPAPESFTGSGSTTTTTKKTVYVLVSTPSAGKQYILVSRNTADSGYALKENTTTGSSITVNAAGNGISAPYIETTDETLMWNAASGMTFQSENGGYYLRYDNGLAFSTRSSTNWTVGTNSAYNYSGSRYRYIYNNDGTWTTSSSRNASTSYNVYFYEKTDVEVETTTTASGTYSIVGNPVEIEKIVAADGTTKATLGSTLTFQPTTGAATVTQNPNGVTYTVQSDPNGIIKTNGISGNTVTFSGKYGEAYVKVSYDVNGNTDGGVVTNYIKLIAKGPTYTITIKNDKGNVVSGTTVSVKDVTEGKTLQLTPSATYDEGNGAQAVTNGTWTWEIPAEYQHLATVGNDGKIVFTGKNGSFYVTATLSVDGVQVATGGVNISAHTGSYSTPSDGTNDFPEYPNPGSVNFDKTASAVGNFAQTGMVEMELSMTGVPVSSPKTLDVVLMLDRSSSMYKSGVQHRITDTIAAAKLFAETIVKNDDGTFNNNRIIIMDFLGGNLAEGSKHKYESNTYTLNDSDGYEIISNQAELEALFKRIDDGFKGQTSLYGTEYDQGLEDCYNALSAAEVRADGNQQFCVFMSDGIPNYMKTEKTDFESTASIVEMFDVTNRTAANGTAKRNATKYEYEYWSTKMKDEGVTVYTVGLGLLGTNSSWSGTSKEVCEQVANMLLNDIAGPAKETAAQRDTGSAVSKLDKYFFSVSDENASEGMKTAFSNIAGQILEAATNVVVTDKITDTYTMVFDIPQSIVPEDNTEAGQAAADRNDHVAEALKGKEMYIEVVNYALDADHDRVDEDEDGVMDHERLLRVYLGINTDNKGNKTYYAANAYGAKGEAGTQLDAPVFTALTDKEKADGKKAYWSEVEVATQAEGDDIIINVNGKAWKFHVKGDGTHNMTAGAYAYGSIDALTNMSEDLVIVTPYFAYCAATRMLAWTTDRLVSTSEIALRYFLYLDFSATEIGTDKEADPGAYPTNEWAYMYYTNHLGNDCRNEFPVPQITWSGAQATYVFYLVNTAGKPINKSGQVVDFANATFVTEPFTHAVVWNRDGEGNIIGEDKLSVEWLADNLLPDDYIIYDEKAGYDLNVYASHTGESLFDFFVLSGSAAGTVNEKNKNTVISTETTKVYNTKAGDRIDTYGVYTSKATDEYNNEIVLENFDFYTTTVAFAVVWQPRLVEDTVVVDYGLDVLIDVTLNDVLLNTVTGISSSNSAYGSIAQDFGVAPNGKFEAKPLTIDGNTISIENENQIRFHQGDMEFKKAVTFYYESPVEFWEGSVEKNGYIHSKVTVIPATTIYYEDSFVQTSAYEWKNGWTETSTGVWTQEGTTTLNAVQNQDRPGKSQISTTLDADNLYGSDGAYKTMTTLSLDSAMVAHVDYDHYAAANFTFAGTGFDVISLTSSKTGTITVQVVSKTTNNVMCSYIVDTYYGYTKDAEGNWVIDSTASDNALYQVPVMKIKNLPYDTYDVEILVQYAELFDHGQYNDTAAVNDGAYDFYLDAIRIYDPTGNKDAVSNDAYLTDGEAWPVYKELRNLIIDANTFGDDVTVNGKGDDKELSATTAVGGIVFIDGNGKNESIADYYSYGPNNELYLAPGQSVAFEIADVFVNSANQTVKPVDVQLAIKTVGGVAALEIFNPGIQVTTKTEGNTETKTSTAVKDNLLKLNVNTATDMYYSIAKLADGVIVISNPSTSENIISITNMKFTFQEKATVKTVATTNEETGEELLTELDVVSISEGGAVFAMRALSRYSTSETYEVPVEPETPAEPEKPNKNDKPVNNKPAKNDKPVAPQLPDYQEIVRAAVKKVVKTIESVLDSMKY